jgi:hypothetical protein
MIEPWTHSRGALVVAHPGHELRVYGWLEATRPQVFVLTDGSGRSGHSRLSSTTSLLNGVRAVPGSIYGRLTDVAAYKAILHHDFEVFIDMARELSGRFIDNEIEYVAGDAIEGYNPMHDVCRLVLNAAVGMAGHAHHRAIGNFDFLLMGRPDDCPEGLRSTAFWLHLDDATFARKVASARTYPELAAEVDVASSVHTLEAFRVECLRPVGSAGIGAAFIESPPFYESYGAQQVAAGHYQQVIRYRQHLLPLADALQYEVHMSRQ